MHRRYYVIVLLFIAGMYACNKEFIEPFAGFQQPANFPAPAYHFATNPVTKEGFELGRKLFYDPVLSANNTISCASCHAQTSAFTHNGHSVSHGIEDRLGTRNSPSLMNLAWSNSFMWDGGITDLDLQPIAPIKSHEEMDNTVENILLKLRQDNKYVAMFHNAYGTEEITGARFLKSLSQFMLMCVSSNSKYDSVMRKQGAVAFTPAEEEGYALFKQRCSACHAEPFFTDGSFRNNGISISNRNDEGRYEVTLREGDKYRFKVPSLRNLSFTPPYMHDGRFFTIEAVLDHYSDGVQQTPNLDPLLVKETKPGIILSVNEKLSIVTFLKTLDDRVFLKDKLLSE